MLMCFFMDSKKEICNSITQNKHNFLFINHLNWSIYVYTV